MKYFDFQLLQILFDSVFERLPKEVCAVYFSWFNSRRFDFEHQVNTTASLFAPTFHLDEIFNLSP